MNVLTSHGKAVTELNKAVEEIGRLRAALQQIVDWCPATQEVTLAHQMAEVAEAALAHNDT